MKILPRKNWFLSFYDQNLRNGFQSDLRLNFRKCLSLFSIREKKRYFISMIAAALINLLDLLAIALMSALASMLLFNSQALSGSTQAKQVEIFNIPISINSSLIFALVVLVVLLLMAKTFLSIILTKRVFRFLSIKSTEISKTIIQDYLELPLDNSHKKTNQEILFSATQGADAITVLVLGNSLTLFGDCVLLAVIIGGLFLVSPSMAGSALLFFSLVAFVLYRLLNLKSKQLGEQSRRHSIQSNEKILETLGSYREIVVRDAAAVAARVVSRYRRQGARVLAEVIFLPYIGKYVMESSIVFGAIFISGIQLLTSDSKTVLTSLGVFVVASSRIVPAILRIQQGSVQIQNSLGLASATLDLLDEFNILKADELAKMQQPKLQESNETNPFEAKIEMRNVGFSYSTSADRILNSLTLSIKKGEFVAIVGPSGAGKSTLMDLMLGIIRPDSGAIEISGESPRTAFKIWPYSVAYVPQEVGFISGTLRDNLVPEFSTEEYSDSELLEILATLSLNIQESDQQTILDTSMGELGSRLSGGQKQIVALARAVIYKPQLVFLDEITSSLDSSSEAEIANFIEKIRGNITIVMIAHRLSTIKKADTILYLDGGEILGSGTFEEVRRKVPKFDEQARYLGL